MCITLVIYHESLHDARSTKCKKKVIPYCHEAQRFIVFIAKVNHSTQPLHSLDLIYIYLKYSVWAGWLSRYSDCLRAGRYGDRIAVGARFSAPVQTGPEAHPASCTMGTGSFPGVSCGRGVTLTPHPLLMPRSKIE